MIMWYVAGIALLWSILHMRRVHKVFDYRQKVREHIVNKNRSARYQGIHERWASYDEVSFDKMCYIFWRKPSSFFEKSFLEDIGME